MPPTAASTPISGKASLSDRGRSSHKTHFVAGMSGGVDSSVTASLLADAGHRVTGLFMKNWEEDDAQGCSAATDLADAERVASVLGIELRTVNFATEYWDRVFTEFLREHEAGRTPNPDVICNREIKFKEFKAHAEWLGAEKVATGHYARVVHEDSEIKLLRAKDRSKDQTYFLHALSQSALAAVEFPLGELHKSEVRTLAAARGLPTHDKRDSTGICFIGERPFRQFLGRFLRGQQGPILDQRGRLVGSHRGAVFYTIGQRRGIGIGGVAGTTNEPWYVYAKCVTDNTLQVVQGTHHPLLYSNTVRASRAHWIAGTPPGGTFYATAKTRYRQPDQACRVAAGAGGLLEVLFELPQRAITPGQFIVFYDGEECLGGAIIEASWTAH